MLGRCPGGGRAFSAWAPTYLPAGLAIEIAVDTPLTEPEFFYLGFQRGRARVGQEPVTHAIPLTEITDVSIGGPATDPRSMAAQWAAAIGLASFDSSSDHVLRLTFDQAITGGAADLRPDLPLLSQW